MRGCLDGWERVEPVVTIPDNMSHWLTCAYLSFYFTALVLFAVVGIVGLLLIGEGLVRLIRGRLPRFVSVLDGLRYASSARNS